MNPAGIQETMSDSNDPKSSGPAVPDLIEQYRLRRDAWIAQADELARLRDEVRGSAEREAMEIVTAARRDVRQIVMEARRELLVLSAQVQAALGEAGAQPNPAALLNRAADTDEGVDDDDSNFPETIFAPEEAVKGMLEEARADMDALAEDARTVPFEALKQAPVLLPPPPEPASVPETFFFAPAPAVDQPAPAMSSGAASRMLLSSPFPTDAVPVPPGHRVRTFVILFGVVGVAVLAGTIYWLRSDGSTTETASRSTTPPAAASSNAAPTVSPAATETPKAPASNTTDTSSNLSIVVEARRPSWLRTTVDGETDAGRTLSQGEKFSITAQRSVSLRVGDAGAVYVSVNNGEAVPLGQAGQVVTRQFTVESRPRDGGATQPQPAAPVTPSAPPALSSPVASGSSTVPPPAPAPVTVPLVQSVAAGPPSSAPAPSAPPSPRPEPPRAETTTPPPAPRAELPTPGPSTPTSAVLAASRQWLDAYHRQDRAAMASLSSEGLQLADERRNEERFPANVNVNRTLDRVSVQIAADTAVLTAVMTERAADNAAPPRVSPISQVWELRENQWRVRQVRLVSEARLNQIFR